MLRLAKGFTAGILVLTLLCGYSSRARALEDAILAIVNDQLITLSDLRDYIKGVYVSLVAEGITQERIKEIMLDLEINGLTKLIEDKLVISRANELGLLVKDKLIDDRIDKLKGRYPDGATFEEALFKNGGTLSDLRGKVTDQLKTQFVIEHEVRSKIFVNPQEVTQYYQENLNSFETKEKVELKSIYLTFGNNKTRVLRKASIALELLESGENFDAIADEYSETPYIGTVERGQLIPSIEKIVFHLKENTPSDLVKTEEGVYIFLLTQRFPQEIASLEDVKVKIENFLFSQKFQERLLDWIVQLKKDAYVEIKQ